MKKTYIAPEVSVEAVVAHTILAASPELGKDFNSDDVTYAKEAKNDWDMWGED